MGSVYFNQKIIEMVWKKALIIEGFDAEEIRKDICGALIKKNLYGQQNSQLSMGWQIDFIKPVEIGGLQDLSNLQALQWENKKSKEQHYPSWNCKVTFRKTKNEYTQ